MPDLDTRICEKLYARVNQDTDIVYEEIEMNEDVAVNKNAKLAAAGQSDRWLPYGTGEGDLAA